MWQIQWILIVNMYRSLCSHRQHGLRLAEALRCIPDSTSGPAESLGSHLLRAIGECVQMCVHAHCPSLAPASSEGHLGGACSARLVSAGSVSVSSLRPALCGNENKDVAEEALHQLLLCSKEGTLVRLLQDASQTQAEAGLSCGRVETRALRLWVFTQTVLIINDLLY